MCKIELMDYLIVEVGFKEDYVAEMTNTELLDNWLKYNGIIGFTEDIKDVVRAAFDVDLED